jgi:trehalose 6-phosphate phosphatase
MDTDPALDAAISLCRATLAATPAGLATDFDGTLAPIVDDPAAVAAVPGAREALDALASRLAVVALVTGRGARDARQLVGTDRVAIAGNHGVEWLPPGEAEVAPDRREAEIHDALARVLGAVPVIPGIEVEDKGLSATVHYRNALDPAAARRRVLDVLAAALAAETALTLRHGRMSVELRAPALGDKGLAVRTIVDRYGLAGLVVMGDDVTDLDMFRAAHQLRASGRLQAAVVAVGGGDEVPAEVAAAADVVIGDAVAAAALLDALARG